MHRSGEVTVVGLGQHPGASQAHQGQLHFFPDASTTDALAAAAAGFVAILSLSNAIGRILWSSASDYLGRKNMYRIYLGIGSLLYLTVTLTTNANKVVFLASCMLILSFYGAGFATVPAYLCNELIRPVHQRFAEPLTGRRAIERAGAPA